MIPPPFQLPDGELLTPPTGHQPVGARPLPLVWVAVAGILALMAIGSLLVIVSPPGISGDQLKIHRALADAETDLGLTVVEPGSEKLKEVIAGLDSLKIEDPAAKGTLARALLILRQTDNSQQTADFTGLNDTVGSSDDALTPGADSAEVIGKINDALRKLYASAPPTREEAAKIADLLAQNDARWPMDLAVARARSLAGGEKPKQDVGRAAMVGVIGFAALAIGVACLALIFVKPKPLGQPVQGSKADGDWLGMRFLIYLGAMLGVGTLAAMLGMDGETIDTTTILLLTDLGMIAAVYLIVRLPLGGRSYTLKDIGLRSENVWQDVLYGLIAFFANLPAVLALAAFGMLFLRWIPSGGHPIQGDLLDTSKLPLLILAAGPLTAFVEEVGFRGLLFQGLALRLRLWPAIILAGFGFAMIHPQGGALWPALAWIGGMAAYLTHQRKSLIPSIVMHACHNTALILFFVVATGG